MSQRNVVCPARFHFRALPVEPRRAFTLVELLVVIGIIALLISILLPTLSRVREQGQQVKCLSSLRQVGTSFIMYAGDNKNYLPRSAGGAVEPSDFLHWQQGRDINESAIAPYMAKPFSPIYFICPSDDVNVRAEQGAGGWGYRYSYGMNMWMGYPKGYNIVKVRNSQQKVLLYEEDERTVDDGNSDAVPGDNIDLLAIRHDRKRKDPDNTTTGLTLNGDRRGNAVFCDGHADYVSRKDLHSPAFYDPLYVN